MWIIEGSFDGKVTGEFEHRKSKLLKCGRSYVLSRKLKQATHLIVNSKSISSEHAIFVVGKHETTDVSDPNVVPKLTLVSKHKKPVFVFRNKEKNQLAADEEMELQSGDEFRPVASVSLSVKWKPVCCLLPKSTSAFSFEKCATLGIKLFSVQSTSVTHFLTPTLEISPSILCSLLRMVQIVHPDWLTEYIRLGDVENTDHDPVDEGPPLTALEFEFLPPSETAHRPSFSPSLPFSLANFKTWERNEEREMMFKGWRILFVGEKGREADRDLLQMLDAGGADYEVFDVSGGEPKFRPILAKNQRKASRGLSIIADEDIMQVAAESEWNAIKGVLKESKLRVVKRSKLLEAVLYINTDRLDSSQEKMSEEESLPIGNPSPIVTSQPENPSNASDELQSLDIHQDSSAQTGPSRRPLRRRGTAGSSATTAAPSAPAPDTTKAAETIAPTTEQGVQVEAETRQARKPLVRRSRTAAVTNATLDKAIVGVDDPSIVESQPPVIDAASSAMPPPSEPVVAPPTTDSITAPAVGRSSRLKRRRNANDAVINPILAELQRDIEQVSQIPPPLKKFKALFDETDPEKLGSQSGAIASSIDNNYEEGLGPTQSNADIMQSRNTETQSQTQTQSENTAPRFSRKIPVRLQAVAEEAEETQSKDISSLPTPVNPPSADIEMNDMAVEIPPPNQVANSIKTKPVSTTDSAMLGTFSSTQKPVSSKPGKAKGAAPGKPDTDNVFLKAIASTKKGKKGEDDFDREFNNLRISKPELERDAQAKDWELLADFGDDGDLRGNFMVILEMDVPERLARDAPTASTPPAWQGKPNYKLFKKKQVGYRNPIELVVDDENDYGMGSAYWKAGSQSQLQSQSQGDGLSFLEASQTPIGSSSKPPSKLKGKTSVKVSQPKRGRSRSALAGDSGVEEDNEIVALARAKRATQQSRRTAEKSHALFLPDVEEEPATLDDEGSGEMFDLDLGDLSVEEDEDEPPPTRAKGRAKPAQETSSKRKRPAALMDDESAFKGFGARKKART